jgi:hypothetical protein
MIKLIIVPLRQGTKFRNAEAIESRKQYFPTLQN